VRLGRPFGFGWLRDPRIARDQDPAKLAHDRKRASPNAVPNGRVRHVVLARVFADADVAGKWILRLVHTKLQSIAWRINARSFDFALKFPACVAYGLLALRRTCKLGFLKGRAPTKSAARGQVKNTQKRPMRNPLVALRQTLPAPSSNDYLISSASPLRRNMARTRNADIQRTSGAVAPPVFRLSCCYLWNFNSARIR
jgi:hypothetical protein